MPIINKRKFVENWIKDLRSGKFLQGTEQLHYPDNHYCCLGVACVTGRRMGINRAELGGPFSEQASGDGTPGEWFHMILSSFDPHVCVIEHESHGLTYCNDELGLNFKEIADLIENQILPTIPNEEISLE